MVHKTARQKTSLSKLIVVLFLALAVFSAVSFGQTALAAGPGMAVSMETSGCEECEITPTPTPVDPNGHAGGSGGEGGGG